MRLSLAVSVLLASSATAFVAPFGARPSTAFFSTVEAETSAEAAVEVAEPAHANGVAAPSLSSSEIKDRLEKQLEKLREKDSKSPQLSKAVSRIAANSEF